MAHVPVKVPDTLMAYRADVPLGIGHGMDQRHFRRPDRFNRGPDPGLDKIAGHPLQAFDRPVEFAGIIRLV